jgi:DNA-binding transcriptional regulator WhiA
MNFYEFLGVFLGDGCIVYNPVKHIYDLEFSGNALDQKEYFKDLGEFIFSDSGKMPKIWIKEHRLGHSLCLRLDNKKYVEHLIFEVGLVYRNKCFNAQIPERFMDWKYSKDILRGLFESDGSLFFSKSKKHNFPTYPRLEIKTSSKKLSEQIMFILKRKQYKVNIMSSKSDKTFRIYLSGAEMLEKWSKEIGFSDIKSISKYNFWKKYGFYIAKISLEERLFCLNAEIAKRPKMFSGKSVT